MTANGPAIKGVCVAKRMEAGAVLCRRGKVLVPARAERLKIALWAILAKEPVCRGERSMPCPDEAERRRGRIFCLPIAIRTGTKFIELYECRGTSLMASRSQVKVCKVLKKAVERSRYIALQICLGSRSKLQKM